MRKIIPASLLIHNERYFIVRSYPFTATGVPGLKDGNLARYRNNTTLRGGFIDSDGIICLCYVCFSWFTYQSNNEPIFIWF